MGRSQKRETMKNRKNNADNSGNQPNKANNYRREKVWKITAIAIIVIFILLVAGGLIKAYYFKSSLIKPTQAQIDYATKIAAEKLKSTGVNSSMLQAYTGSRMRRMHEDWDNMTIMQVSFNNNSASYTYIIDINSGKILLHSETYTYVPFWEHPRKRHAEGPISIERGKRDYQWPEQ